MRIGLLLWGGDLREKSMKNGRSQSVPKAAPGKKSAVPTNPLARVREICLSLPDAFEKEAWGGPTFRARHGMFAMWVDNHHGDGLLGVWVKAAPGLQQILIDENPRVFFRPPYVGHKGWIGMKLDGKADWEQAASLLRQGYEMCAAKPKRPRSARKPPLFDEREFLGKTLPIPQRWR